MNGAYGLVHSRWGSKSKYRVIHKYPRDFRPLRYSSRHGHTGEHVNRGRDTPSFCPYRCSICWLL